MKVCYRKVLFSQQEEIKSTMKKFISIIIFSIISLCTVNQMHAHPQGGNYEKIKAAMVSFYTDYMDLSPDQAAKFWPIHNDYESERRKINREIRTLKKSGNPNDLSKIERLEKARFELRTKYKSRFLEVITPAQLSQMYKAEEDFMRLMLDRMKD